MPRVLPDDTLQEAVEAYYDCEGNHTEAASLIGVSRSTFNHRLSAAQARFGITLKRVADGRIEAPKSDQRRLPKKGAVARYILSSAQNNTKMHPGFNNILALVDWFNTLNDGKDTCELMVGTFTYQLNAYGPKAVKRGSFDPHKANEELWYAREITPYIVDSSVELAPELVWCGEQNILPTTQYPLRSFETYNGRKSNIVPHAKVALVSVASMANDATKFNYTTGTVTQRNYIQKRAGILAEQKHNYGATLVEVDHEGNWFVRQLYIADDDSIMDVGPAGYSGIRVQAGMVQAQPVTEAITWPDIHVAEMDQWVRDIGWGKGGVLDALSPNVQFYNDVFSMRHRSPHEEEDFHATYRKTVEGDASVQDELDQTAAFMTEAHRDGCEDVVIPSNHDRHLEKWLNTADFRKDPMNARTFMWLNYKTLEAMDNGDTSFNVMEFALREAGCPEGALFLGTDESYKVLGIENGLHGDLGPNGSRGSTRSLTGLGIPINKGHDHRATIEGLVFSAGACSMNFPYQKGPTSASVSLIVTYKNGTRSIITMWGGKWRA